MLYINFKRARCVHYEMPLVFLKIQRYLCNNLIK